MAACSVNRWWSSFGKKRAKGGPPVHGDKVLRDFTVAAPNRLLLTDITEHPTDEGKLCLCAVKDVYPNRMVGYSIDSRMTSLVAVNGHDSAVSPRGDVAGCLVHSDSEQFRARKYLRALRRRDLVGSPCDRSALPVDAAMESFFALLQKDVLNRHRCPTRERLRIAIITWIERTHHHRHRRRQERLGRLTPIEYETITTTPATQTA